MVLVPEMLLDLEMPVTNGFIPLGDLHTNFRRIFPLDKYFSEINRFPVCVIAHTIHGLMKFMYVEAL